MFAFNAQANLISNPGFEDRLTDWQSFGNAVIRIADPLAYADANYIFGQSTAEFKVWQDIDLLSKGFSSSVIDTGNLDIVFGGWLD